MEMSLKIVSIKKGGKYMKKRLFSVLFVLFFTVFIVACEGEIEPWLTSITIVGADDTTVPFDEPFNVLEGVTAIGNNSIDYTDQMTYATTAPIDAEGNLDTTSTGVHAVRYEVRVGTIVVQRWRYITVDQPERPDGLVVNGDFALGTVFWDDPANGFFVADGASLSLSIDDGALKADAVSGSNVWTPRFGQQGIPFEQGKAYEVTFRAKASVDKTINLQVGELIDFAPWFIDFKPGQTEHRTITTEWATYTYTFFMGTDNPRGGILFELGNIPPEGTLGGAPFTIWFDDIDVIEIDDLEDTIAPVFSGVRANINLAVDDDFDPLEGVTAMDNVDGDVTDLIDVTIYEVVGETETEIAEIDMSVEGTYRIVYTVSDAAGNEAIAESHLTVILVIVFEYPGWRTFVNFWEGTESELIVEDGVLTFTLTTISAMNENWKAQVIQDAFALGYGEDNEGHMALEAGATYRVTFDAKATVAGDIVLAIGYSIPEWNPYFVEEDIAVTTEWQTISIEFTLDAEGDYSIPAQFKLEMGLLFEGLDAPQSFMLDNVMIEIKVGDDFVPTDLIFNGTMDEEVMNIYALPEWRSFVNFWEGTVGEIKGVNGELVLNVTNISAMNENWKIQVIQDAFALGTGPDNAGHMQLEADNTYRVTFRARASVAGQVTLAIGHSEGEWTPYHTATLDVTTEMQEFVVTFTTDHAEIDYSVLAQFKLEMGLLFADVSSGYFVLDDVDIRVLDGENYVYTGLIKNGTMDAPFLYALEEWRAFVNFWEGTVGNIYNVAGELVLMVDNINAMDANWKIQVIQDAFALGTGPDNAGHMQLEADNTYRVTFRARASVAGEITLAIGHAGGGWTPYHMATLDVTTDMQTFEVIFTTDDDEIDYTVLAQFKLEMGLLFAEESSGYFVLDDVIIEVLDDEDYVDAELIVNGHMNLPAPYELNEWRGFVNFWEGTIGNIHGIAGELIFMIDNISAMDANWKIQVIQDAYALGTGPDNEGHMLIEAGKTYRITFTARASVAGEITLAIGHAGGGWTPYHMETIEVTTERQTFVIEFTADNADPDYYSVLAQFKFEMGMLFAESTSGIFALDNVMIEVLDDETFIDAELIENGTMDKAPNIVDIALSIEDFSTLVAALIEAELVAALQGEGPFTVFAPTNDAFAALLLELDMTAAELLALETLPEILLYHVVAGQFTAADVIALAADGPVEVETLNGATITISVVEGSVFINDIEVTLPDVMASNGVIHVIDGVLLPPAEETPEE
ncbi:MAG: hypothetical protein EA375_03130 [Acholeplasmataceae bacterium]|nr:MAG: hypothetical protein EA375_03130 [Acholeplasmataceae bacterium]